MPSATCAARPRIAQLYPPELLRETLQMAARCSFSLDEIRYQYPSEVVPAGVTPRQHLRHLLTRGARKRWPQGLPAQMAGPHRA